MKATSLFMIALAAGAATMTAARAGSAAADDTPRTHMVTMVMEAGQYRFEPSEVRARAGDRVVFVLQSGAPHNVAFSADEIADAAEPALSRALPDRMSTLAGPLLTTAGTKYTLSLDGVPPGRYPFFCMPHAGMNMKGVLVVEP